MEASASESCIRVLTPLRRGHHFCVGFPDGAAIHALAVMGYMQISDPPGG